MAMTPSPKNVAQRHLDTLHTASGYKYTVRDAHLGTVTVDIVYVDGDSAEYSIMGHIRASDGVIYAFTAYIKGWDSDPRLNKTKVRDFRLTDKNPPPDARLESQFKSAFEMLVQHQSLALGQYLYSQVGE